MLPYFEFQRLHNVQSAKEEEILNAKTVLTYRTSDGSTVLRIFDNLGLAEMMGRQESFPRATKENAEDVGSWLVSLVEPFWRGLSGGEVGADGCRLSGCLLILKVHVCRSYA